MRSNGEQNLDSNAGGSLHPINNAVSFQMMQEVFSERNIMQIVVRVAQADEMRQAFLEIFSLFDPLDAVPDHSFYDVARLAKSQF